MATSKATFEQVLGKKFDDLTFEDVRNVGNSALNNLDYRLDYLDNLKQDVQAGKMTLADYTKKAAEFSQDTGTLLGNIQHTKEAPASLSRVPRLRQFFSFDTPEGLGNIQDVKLPFTRTEYAKLDPSVLPTKEDVDTGLISRDSMPFERYNTPTDGPASPDDQIPNDINLGTDRGKVELEAKRQADQLQSALDQQKTIRKDASNTLAQSLSGIPQKFYDEGNTQEQMLRTSAGEQRDLRASSLTQLAELLAQQQSARFNDMVPEIAEQANVKGIYRSTGFGDALAKEGSKLERDRQTQLGLQGVSDYQQYVDALGNATNRNLDLRTTGVNADSEITRGMGELNYGIEDAYAGGLADVANHRAGLQTAGLQRAFSIDDVARASNLAQLMAAAQQPQSQGKTTGEKWAQGIQAGSAALGSGAAAYGAKK